MIFVIKFAKSSFLLTSEHDFCNVMTYGNHFLHISDLLKEDF